MTIAPVTAKTIIREARKEFNRMQDIVTDWEDMVKDCRKNGLRPKYCVHGTYQWTDYDNICGGCENGDFPQDRTYMMVLEDTLQEYRWVKKNMDRKSQELFKAYSLVNDLGMHDLASKMLLDGLNELLGKFAY